MNTPKPTHFVKSATYSWYCCIDANGTFWWSVDKNKELHKSSIHGLKGCTVESFYKESMCTVKKLCCVSRNKE